MTIIAEAIESLFDLRAPNLPASGFAEILDRLVWCLGDNGASVLELQRNWLAGDDMHRVEIGLMMEEANPYNDINEAKSNMNRILAKWPELKSACRQFSGQWSLILDAPPET